MRRRYVINARFQAKYTLAVILLVLAIFGLLGSLYLREQAAARTIMEEINPLVSDTATGAAEDYAREFDRVSGAVEDRDQTRGLLLLGLLGVLVVVLAGTGILVTHRIAGPMFALEAFMEHVEQGHWKRLRPFRSKDEFRGLSLRFMKMAEAIRGRHRGDLERLEQIQRQLADGRMNEAMRLAEALALEKRQFVGDEVAPSPEGETA